MVYTLIRTPETIYYLLNPSWSISVSYIVSFGYHVSCVTYLSYLPWISWSVDALTHALEQPPLATFSLWVLRMSQKTIYCEQFNRLKILNSSYHLGNFSILLPLSWILHGDEDPSLLWMPFSADFLLFIACILSILLASEII